MAAIMSNILRNYSKAASANRMLFSNPCLASMTKKQVVLTDKSAGNQLCIRQAVKPFSVSSPSFQQDCKSGDDYAKLWTIERGVAIALVPLVPAAFFFPSAAMDYIIAFSFTLHAHWGLEAIVVDYVRPKVVGPVLAKVAVALVYGLSAFTLGGLFYFNYTDVGIVNAIKMFWKL